MSAVEATLDKMYDGVRIGSWGQLQGENKLGLLNRDIHRILPKSGKLTTTVRRTSTDILAICLEYSPVKI